MLIPTGGFRWVIGDRDVAMQGNSECVLNLAAETATGVDVTSPGRQPWGCAAAFADPDGHVWMVTSQLFPK
jgi:uncharacterized glyoxalase superfamily protein PhnB